MHAQSMNEIDKIASLFFDEGLVRFDIINTSHGELDFREAVIVELESGRKLVIKLADNDFTFDEKIRVWQKCSEDYRALGYYTPVIVADKTGTFPRVSYKGHNCVVYVEEFAAYSSADKVGKGLASNEFIEELLIMTAKVAKLYSNYTKYPSGYCLFDRFCPSDQHDEVMDNAIEWKQYAETLPQVFQNQIQRIWKNWMENRRKLYDIYPQLPTSVFQADLNSSNVLVDENGLFVGVYDFNLCGKDVLLNYLIREINTDNDEEELKKIVSSLSTIGKVYEFSEIEKDAVLLLYRCNKPLWYTKLQRLKHAGTDETGIQECLDQTEFMLMREIDFFE